MADQTASPQTLCSQPAQTTLPKRAVSAVVLWKLAIFELIVMCALTAGNFYQSWMAGDTDWSSLSTSRKMLFKVGMVMQVLLVIKAFLSQTVSNVSKGINLPPGSSVETQTWMRRQTQVDTLQTSVPPKSSSTG